MKYTAFKTSIHYFVLVLLRILSSPSGQIVRETGGGGFCQERRNIKKIFQGTKPVFPENIFLNLILYLTIVLRSIFPNFLRKLLHLFNGVSTFGEGEIQGLFQDFQGPFSVNSRTQNWEKSLKMARICRKQFTLFSNFNQNH